MLHFLFYPLDHQFIMELTANSELRDTNMFMLDESLFHMIPVQISDMRSFE